VQRSRAVAASLSYAWMLDLVFGGKPTVTWALAGSLPQGYERAEQFAVLPSGSGRSFLVSLASRIGAASALTSYNALRPRRRRLARRALGLGLRTGLAQPLIRTRIDVGIRVGASRERVAADLLSEHLCQLLGAEGVIVALSGGDGPYRKPVLQVFGTTGTPLGYVKVGWNDWTRDGVRREADALVACANRPMQIGVPKVLGISTWHGLDLLVTSPLPRHVRGLGTTAALPPAAALREICGLSAGSRGPLSDSLWWHGVRSRIRTSVHEPAARSVLQRVAGQLERDHGHVPLEFGFWHGDLVPWNLARLGERLYAWDWESSATAAPLGFDAVHFHFQVAFVDRGVPLAEAADLAAQAAWPTLRDLGVPAAGCKFFPTLHLIELFLRHEEARRSAGDADERFYPAITGVLEQRLAAAPAPGSTAVGSMA
jgi:hypothetical protein